MDENTQLTVLLVGLILVYSVCMVIAFRTSKQERRLYLMVGTLVIITARFVSKAASLGFIAQTCGFLALVNILLLFLSWRDK
jgi:hypothetical protein